MVAPGCAGAAAAAAGAAAAGAGVPHKGELLLTGKLRLHLPMPRLRRRGTEIDLTLFYFILHAPGVSSLGVPGVPWHTLS